MTTTTFSRSEARTASSISGRQPRLTYLYNANILTMNPDCPRGAHALLCDNKIWDVGDDTMPLGLDFRETGFESQRRSLGRDVTFIDLKGQTIIPGLHDAHVHFMMWALYQSRVDLTPGRSEQHCIELMRDHAAKVNLKPGEWLVGFGWAHNLWDKPQFPSRASLDTAFPNNPVYMDSKCGHVAWVNGAALAAAQVDESTQDPPGGELERESGHGSRLTGILKENASSLVASNIAEASEDMMRLALENGTRIAHSFGLTSLHTPEPLRTWDFLQAAQLRQELNMRINFWIPVAALDSLEALNIRHGLGDDWLRVTGVKLFTDGSLGGRTALMYDPYENEPGNRGICVTEREELRLRTLQANKAGLAMAVHAIGDLAVEYCIAAYEAAADEFGVSGAVGTTPLVRNRIEHLQVFSDRDLERLRKLQPTASMQPIHLCADMGPADKFWGKRARYAYALRTLSELGCPLAFGSDAPVEPINPFYGFYAAVTRNNLEGTPGDGWYPEEKLDIMETIAAYTKGPAVAAGTGHSVGDLSPGKLADFVVLKEDPSTVSSSDLKNILPVATYADGECVYASTDWQHE